jgi:hypothetical protein
VPSFILIPLDRVASRRSLPAKSTREILLIREKVLREGSTRLLLEEEEGDGAGEEAGEEEAGEDGEEGVLSLKL